MHILHVGNHSWMCLISITAKTAAMYGVYVWAVVSSLDKEYTAIHLTKNKTAIHHLEEWLPKEEKHLVASQCPAPITCLISSL